VGRDVSEEMWKQNLRGAEKEKARQQAPGDRFGPACGQQGEKQPSRVAKSNVHGYDSPGVEWQGYSFSPQTTPSLIY
jgi:hypothetical protein